MKELCDQMIFVTLEAEPHVEPEVVSSEPEPEPEAESIDEASEPVEIPEVSAAQVEANQCTTVLMTLRFTFQIIEEDPEVLEEEETVEEVWSSRLLASFMLSFTGCTAN